MNRTAKLLVIACGSTIIAGTLELALIARRSASARTPVAEDDKHTAERIDTTCARTFQAQLEAFVAIGFPDSAVMRASCRSTMCRLEVKHHRWRPASVRVSPGQRQPFVAS